MALLLTKEVQKIMKHYCPYCNSEQEYYIDKILDAENRESIMDVKQVEKIVFEILSEQD